MIRKNTIPQHVTRAAPGWDSDSLALEVVELLKAALSRAINQPAPLSPVHSAKPSMLEEPMRNSDTYALLANLQHALRDHVQSLRLFDLKAHLPALTEIAWKSTNRQTEDGSSVVGGIDEIRLRVRSPLGPVWISLGAGDLDDQLDRFVESLEGAAGIEEPSVDAALATTTNILGLPRSLETWKELAILALNYVEDSFESDGRIDVEHYLKEVVDDPERLDAGALAEPLAAARATAAGLWVENYLIASNSHISEAERVQLDAGRTPSPYMVVSLTGDYGWLIHLVDAIPESVPGISEGLAAVVRLARAHGLHYIRLDSEGPVLEGVPTYEW